MKMYRGSHRAAALIIVLGFIAMMTIIVVGLLGGMLVERSAANSHFEKTRATLYAQQGVNDVVATLDQSIQNPNLYWISQPGQLVTSAPSATSTTAKNLQNVVPLSSGASTLTSAAPAYLQPPNLNVPVLQNASTHLITEDLDPNTGVTATMPVKWIYVRQDGSFDTTEQPAFTAGNPIVGRYAYWTDDESSKINYNLAWTRQSENTNPSSNPTMVDLTALQNSANSSLNVTTPIADAIHQFITTDNYLTTFNFFNTPEDARRVSSNAAKALSQYKFEVTHFNHDPNTTFFNEPRIVLTTRPDRAGWTYTNGQWIGTNGQSGAAGTPHYIRLLANEGTGALAPSAIPAAGSTLDPGVPSNLDSGKFTDTLNLLVENDATYVGYLVRTDWPMISKGAGATSFQNKYYALYPTANRSRRLIQLAIDIMDYVRTSESPQAIVPPLRMTESIAANGTATYVLGAPSAGVQQSDNSFIGSSRMPFINEVGIWYQSGSNGNGGTNYTPYIKFEILDPPNYNIPANYNVSSLSLGAYGLNNTTVISPAPIPTLAGATLSSATISPGQYLTFAVKTNETPATTAPKTGQASYRVFMGVSGLGQCDIVPLSEVNPNTYFLKLPIDASSIDPNGAITSLETDDPRINAYTADQSLPSTRTWKATAVGKNSFGSVNAFHTVGGTPLVSASGGALQPQQDTNAAGNISDASFYMPPPAGQGTNTAGYVTSVGELGYIHTGIEVNNEALSDPTNTNSGEIVMPPPTPWRSLRLQPNNYADTSTVPDWALMDLFTVPVIVNPNADAVYAPHDTAIGGRVNVNANQVPFGLQRILPLTAVLQGCTPNANSSTTLSASDAQAFAQNIYNRTLATNGKQYGVYGSDPSDTAYVSPGEVVEIKGIADGGEQSEQLVRQIGNLTTARGGVFSVYTVGQSIKQTSTGMIVVTGEQRVQAIVERYVTNPTLNTASFRTVYCRNLLP